MPRRIVRLVAAALAAAALLCGLEPPGAVVDVSA
jgi:hypothetical protein